MNKDDGAVVAVSVLASVGTVLLMRKLLRGPKGDLGPPGPMGMAGVCECGSIQDLYEEASKDPEQRAAAQKRTKEREVIEYLVTKVLDPDALPFWWDAPMHRAPGALRGLTPNEAMAQGLGAVLHEYVKNYSDPSFT